MLNNDFTKQITINYNDFIHVLSDGGAFASSESNSGTSITELCLRFGILFIYFSSQFLNKIIMMIMNNENATTSFDATKIYCAY